MNKLRTRVLAGSPSVLLDSLRLGASLTVVCIHAHGTWFPELIHNNEKPGDIAHAAVVVFFVLSGYVIAHTTAGNNRGAIQYAQARLSRLYSVVLPALVLTALAEFILLKFNPLIATEFIRPPSWPRYLLTAGFLNEIWFKSAAPPINGPLWSLGFEFWYYLIFGLWFYRSSGWRGLILSLIACIIAGPKILLMMPIWLLGVVAYRLPRPSLSSNKAWTLVFAALFIASIAIAYLPPFPTGIGHEPLFFASQFLTDWATGFFVALALWILPSSNSDIASREWANWFRKIADLTFPIYVLHNPILALFKGLTGNHPINKTQLLLIIVLTLITSSLIGIVLEAQRPFWTNLFKKILHSRSELSKKVIVKA